jgi:hypothetical protein
MSIFCLSSFNLAQAGEHKEEKAESKAEPKSEGKEEGKDKKAKAVEDSYVHVQLHVQTFEAKIRSGKEELVKLIEEKKISKDPVKIAEIIKEMILVHKEIEKNIKEYDLQRSLLKYRYPEKGRSEKREYERIELQPVEEIEGQLTLANSVNHSLKKVRSQYETPAEIEKNEKLNKAKQNRGISEPFVLKK